MATADEYAQWIVNNADKRGTPDFETVSKAYQDLRMNTKPDQGFSTGEMLSNAPGSLWKNTIGGLYEAASSPLKTATGLMDMAAGGLQNLTPAPVRNLINKANVGSPFLDPDAAARSRGVASAVGQDYANTYGSASGFGKTMQEDPFRVLGDISLLATGGASATTRLPGISNALSKTAAITNPMNALIKSASLTGKYGPEIGANAIGLITGVGPETVKESVKAGFRGTEAFRENMRGTVPMTRVLEDARTNLSQMIADKQATYRSGMADISKDRTALDFTGIDNALSNAENKYAKYKGVEVSEASNNLLTAIKTKIENWKKLNPDEFHTPEGMDKLKQVVWSEIEKLPKDSKTAYLAGKEIYNAIAAEIGTQAPTYAKVMKGYTESSDLIHEIEHALSLGHKASAETALRKLQSLTRDNVTTNYGQRTALAKQLVDAGGNEIMPALAGQAMSSTLPRGLIGQGGAAGALFNAATTMSPAMLATLPFMSPRLMGEAGYALGDVARRVNQSGPIQNYLRPTIENANRLAQQSGVTSDQAKRAALLAAQAGAMQERYPQ